MEAVFHRNFKKKYQKLPQDIQKKFDSALYIFLRNKFDKKLNNHSVDRIFPDCRSINVTGDYRAIFHENSEVVVFITIGTHADLYG